MSLVDKVKQEDAAATNGTWGQPSSPAPSQSSARTLQNSSPIPSNAGNDAVSMKGSPSPSLSLLTTPKLKSKLNPIITNSSPLRPRDGESHHHNQSDKPEEPQLPHIETSDLPEFNPTNSPPTAGILTATTPSTMAINPTHTPYHHPQQHFFSVMPTFDFNASANSPSYSYNNGSNTNPTSMCYNPSSFYPLQDHNAANIPYAPIQANSPLLAPKNEEDTTMKAATETDEDANTPQQSPNMMATTTATATTYTSTQLESISAPPHHANDTITATITATATPPAPELTAQESLNQMNMDEEALYQVLYGQPPLETSKMRRSSASKEEMSSVNEESKQPGKDNDDDVSTVQQSTGTSSGGGRSSNSASE
jgi:hypothetical protein